MYQVMHKTGIGAARDCEFLVWRSRRRAAEIYRIDAGRGGLSLATEVLRRLVGWVSTVILVVPPFYEGPIIFGS